MWAHGGLIATMSGHMVTRLWFDCGQICMYFAIVLRGTYYRVRGGPYYCVRGGPIIASGAPIIASVWSPNCRPGVDD